MHVCIVPQPTLELLVGYAGAHVVRLDLHLIPVLTTASRLEDELSLIITEDRESLRELGQEHLADSVVNHEFNLFVRQLLWVQRFTEDGGHFDERLEGAANDLRVVTCDFNKLLFDAVLLIRLLNQLKSGVGIQVDQHLQVLDEAAQLLWRQQHCTLLLQ